MSNVLKINKHYVFGYTGTFGFYHEESGELTEISGTKLVFDDDLHLDFFKDIKWIVSIKSKELPMLREISPKCSFQELS